MPPDSPFALNLKPPYWAVIFASRRTAGEHGYGAMAQRMGTLAAAQPGYLGFESVRGADGFGVTISYWDSPEAIRNWKDQAEHLVAQESGVKQWYEHYEVRVARVERGYAGPSGGLHSTAWDVTG
jgi:heme-degrading monooxygenase HmoA